MTPHERELRIQTLCLLILTTVAVAAALYWLRSVMIPFVLAAFIAVALAPVIDAQVRYLRIPRGLAIVATLTLALFVVNLISGFVSASVVQLAGSADLYQERAQKLISEVTRLMRLDELPFPQGAQPITPLSVERISGILMGTTNALLGIVSQSFLVMIFVIFLLLGGSSVQKVRGTVWTEVESRVRRYLLAKTLVSAVTGVLVWLTLALLGIDLAMVFGLFAFLLHFIPSIGSVIATLLPLPVVLVNPEVSPTVAVLAILVPAAIHFVIGNFVDPKLMGQSLDLHPVSVLLALMVWGAVWGVIGMFLATPLTAIMKILFERSELTAPIADLMAGRLDALQSR
jgi:AI-2 transport protein TqsA